MREWEEEVRRNLSDRAWEICSVINNQMNEFAVQIAKFLLTQMMSLMQS
jgi:hypothetical protein